ncbi:MAG: hypothetical protein K6A40_12800 [Solobacterium sp.]|nr:hypothetical protein [Solobacterium sp.]
MARKVCDFCLRESKGLFGAHETLKDGHHMCKNCKDIIQSYGLPLKYDLFQCLVTAQPNMKEMIMDAYLEKNKPDDCLTRHYPYPQILMHEGEHCVNAVKATITVKTDLIPEGQAVTSIAEIQKRTIHNIPDTSERTGNTKVTGMLYETEAALYFVSEHIINCHRLGYMQRNRKENDRVCVVTPTKTFTYRIAHADLFYLRERFFQKVNAKRQNKGQHLIYITNDNEIRITPGVYDIPKSLKPGLYQVKAIKDSGLHIRDALGRVVDYYESEKSIHLRDGGVLECTGEYQLKWIGESTDN